MRRSFIFSRRSFIFVKILNSFPMQENKKAFALYEIWSKILDEIENKMGLNSIEYKTFIEDIRPYDILLEGNETTMYVVCSSKKIYNDIEVNEKSSFYAFEPFYSSLKKARYKCKYTVTDNLTDYGFFNKGEYLEVKKMLLKYRTYREAQKASAEAFEAIKRKNEVGVDSLVTFDSTYRQSNKLTRAKFDKLNITQKKVLNYLIWKYQHSDSFNKSILEECSFIITANELTACGCGSNPTVIFRNLMKLGKDTWMLVKDDKDLYTTLPMFNKFAQISKNEISVVLSEVLVSLINKLSLYGEFTIINRNAINATKSYFSLRIYELCCQYRNSGKYLFYITDIELRNILECTQKYESPIDFKNKVLKVAEKELKELAKQGKSDIYFSFAESEKKKKTWDLGRKEVVSWIFYIHKDLKKDGYIPHDSAEEKYKLSKIIISDIIHNYISNNVMKKNFLEIIENIQKEDLIPFARKLQNAVYISVDAKEDSISYFFKN